MEGKLLKSQEVAEKLGVSKSYVYQLISNGELPVVRLGEKAIRIRPEDLDRFLEKSSKNSKTNKEIVTSHLMKPKEEVSNE